MTETSIPQYEHQTSATIQTTLGARYAKQLITHWRRYAAQIQEDETETVLHFAASDHFPAHGVLFRMGTDELYVESYAATPKGLRGIADAVAEHLMRYASRKETLGIEWSNYPAPELAPPVEFKTMLQEEDAKRVLKRLYDFEEAINWDERDDDDGNPHSSAEIGFSIRPEQGDLLYMLCRSIGAKRVVEFATSLGFSTIYLASAVRDNGGGLVIGAELVPAKVAQAKLNLAEAGVDSFVEIRQGDVLETFRDLPDSIDLALIDGWPSPNTPSLARKVLDLLLPKLRVGALLVNDNAEEDYLEYVRNPANGFITLNLPLKGATEISLKVA